MTTVDANGLASSPVPLAEVLAALEEGLAQEARVHARGGGG
jgi:hypothetical protein